jgi:hypothetical protein
MELGSLFERVSAQVARNAIGRIDVPNKITQNLPIIRSVISGDLDRIANSVLDSTIGADYAMRGLFPHGDFKGRSSLVGGISLADAKAIFDQTSKIEYARKNLFHLQIEDLKPSKESPAHINLFATDVGYSPWTITGDAVRIGTGYMDTVQGSEPVEMQVTTMDDAGGTIKRWFEERASLIGHADGTVGLPIEYLMRVTVTHAVIGSEAIGAQFAKKDVYIMRPGNIQFEKSRREQALEELQMTFVQFDTFSNVV